MEQSNFSISACGTGTVECGGNSKKMNVRGGVHNIEYGVGRNKADVFFEHSTTLAPGETRTINLLDMADSCPGCKSVFAKVKFIFIQNRGNPEAAGQIIEVRSGTFNGPWGGQPGRNQIGPGNPFMVTESSEGWPVASGTSTIDLVNLDTTKEVKLCFQIVGTSI